MDAVLSTLLSTLLGMQIAGLVYIACLFRGSRTYRIIRSMDELLDNLIQEEAPATSEASETPADVTEYRDRLAAIAAGGQAKEYLGRALTVEQIDAMESAEIQKLYARYQGKLGAVMSKTLGESLIQLYSLTVSQWLPIDSMAGLNADLQSDPFVGHALTGLCCTLYHKYGMFLAPLTAALATARHVKRPAGALISSDVGHGDPAADGREDGGAVSSDSD
jgi:hypothetical protein